MFDALNNQFTSLIPDPTTRQIVLAAAGIIVLLLLLTFLRRRRSAAAEARRRATIRQQYDVLHDQQQEVERLALKIIATSSRANVAGFVLVRQIEAVITDGHQSPAKAVEMLKALAARKGANAIINLDSERAPGGKCTARGDAVIVRTVGARPGAGTAAVNPKGEADNHPAGAE